MIDEDLTLKKRRIKWKLVEKARKEKKKGREVEIENRRIWIERKEEKK